MRWKQVIVCICWNMLLCDIRFNVCTNLFLNEIDSPGIRYHQVSSVLRLYSVNHGIRNLICQTLCYTVKSKWGYFSILIWNINTSLHLHKLRNVRFYAPVVMFKLYFIIITTYKYTFTKKNITFCYLKVLNGFICRKSLFIFNKAFF